MPSNERMNWLMHHELVHVVATDKGADSDLRFRQLFHGKVAPIKEEPLSMLYSYLTSPRWYSPRWYHEGIAVFLETWMAGGVGRVLGGYDEMVFRTMVLENAYFYDVVGLESEGTTIDFQVGQNSYLYGTRFMTYLAMKHGPEKLIEWFNRTHGSKRYFASQFEKVFGVSLDDEWQRWIAWEHEWQKKNLARIRQYPVTPETRITGETLGSVSRSFYDPDRKLLYAAMNRPARPAQIVAIDVESGAITPLTEVVAPALYFVTSMAYDAKGRKIFYTTNNSRGWRDLNELDLNTGRRRLLLKNCRTGDLVVNPADQSIWGDAASQRPVDAGGHSAAVRPLEHGADARVRPRHLRHRHLARRQDAERFDDRRHGRAAAHQARHRSPPARRFEIRSAARVREQLAVELRLLARRPLSLRHVVLHRRLERFPLRPADEEDGGGHQCRDGSLPADPDLARHADRVPLRGEGIRAGARCRFTRPRRHQRHQLPRPAGRGEASDREELERRLTGARESRSRSRRTSVRIIRSLACDSDRSIRSSRATRARRPPGCATTSPIRSVSIRSMSRRRFRRRRRRSCISRSTTKDLRGRRSSSTTPPTSTICSDRPK